MYITAKFMPFIQKGINEFVWLFANSTWPSDKIINNKNKKEQQK